MKTENTRLSDVTKFAKIGLPKYAEYGNDDPRENSDLKLWYCSDELVTVLTGRLHGVYVETRCYLLRLNYHLNRSNGHRLRLLIRTT